MAMPKGDPTTRSYFIIGPRWERGGRCRQDRANFNEGNGGMAENGGSATRNDSAGHRKKVPVTVAPSQYLFAADRLLEDADSDGPVRVKNRFQWILTNINFTLGLGPLWRFPMVAYRKSGGAFVVAYTLIFICVGYPLALLEVALGQCTRRRAATVFKLCIALEGLSICMGLYSFLIPIYYNVIFAYAVFYFYHTFDSKELEWTKCYENTFPGYICVRKRPIKPSNNSLVSAEELFWHFHVLKGSKDVDHPQLFSELNPQLVLCLAISWLLVAILLVHKIRKHTVAAEYLLIPLTMLIMIIIIILNVSSGESGRVTIMVRGLKEFFVPSLEIFKDVQIWREATQQVFFSLGVASGPLITLGSLSHFKSPVHIDSAIVCTINFIFSIVSGVALFYAAAVLAQEIGRNTAVVQGVNFFGSGIFFIAFSKVLGELPLPQFWSAIFFLLLFCLGSRAVMGSIDTTVSVVRYFIPLGHRRRFKVQLAGVIVVVSSFLLGLLAVMKGDTLIFVVIENYGGATALPLLAAFECLGVTWIYGVVRFSGDVEFMLDYKPNILLRIIWLGIPLYLIIIVSGTWIHAWIIHPLEGIVPLPLVLAGWLLVLVILLPLPIRFIFNFVELYKKKRLKEIFMSRDDAGPDDLELWFRDEHFFDRISVNIPP